jgi:hypothetical protein
MHGGLNPRPTYTFRNWWLTLYTPLYVTAPGTVSTEAADSLDKLVSLYQTARCHITSAITSICTLYLRFPWHCLWTVRFSWMLCHVAWRDILTFRRNILPHLFRTEEYAKQEISKNTGKLGCFLTRLTFRPEPDGGVFIQNVALTPKYMAL